MDEPVTLEGKVAMLQGDVAELRDIAAHLYIALGNAVEQLTLMSQFTAARAVQNPEADLVFPILKDAAQKLDDRMNQARALIWGDNHHGTK